LAAIVASSNDAIVCRGLDDRISSWNPGAERLFGYTAAEAIGQSLDLIIPENLRQRHWQGFDQTMRTGESRYGAGDLLSVPALRKDGVRISVEFTIVPFRGDDGAMIGVAAIMRDVTQRFEEMRALRKQVAELRG
jgi:PAS domain S-box-containing protein